MSSWLQHRVSIGLVQFEHAHGAIHALAHHEVLARGGDIAEASLQRIGIEKCSATSCLKRCRRHALRYFGYISTGCADFRLTRRWRHMSSLCLPIQIAHHSESVGACRRELYFGLAGRELDVWLRR